MIKSYKEYVVAAKARIKTLQVQEAQALLKDPTVMFVDVRDSAELRQAGKIPGAVNVNRGMLEFAIDPASPFHNPVFASGKKFVFYCAGGGRSALGTATAQDMGLENVANMAGGFEAWKEAGAPVEKS